MHYEQGLDTVTKMIESREDAIWRPKQLAIIWTQEGLFYD